MKLRNWLAFVACAALGVFGLGLLWFGANAPEVDGSSNARPIRSESALSANDVGELRVSEEREAVVAPVVDAPTVQQRLVSLQVVTATAQPVGGADIVHFTGHGARVLGSTDDAGGFVLPPPVRDMGSVQARKAGFWSEVASLQARESDVIQLRLLRGGSVRGVVYEATGAPASGEATVLLWPDSLRAPTVGCVMASLLGDPYVQSTAALPDGSFAFDDLDPRLNYSLAAGAAGRLTSSVVSGVAPGGGSVQLRLSSLYGLRFRLAELGGGPLRSSRQATSDGRVTLQLVGAHPGVEKVPHWLAALAGLTPPQMSSEPYEAAMLYSASADVDSVGPIRCRVDLPGYLPLQVDLYAPPVVQSLTEARIELTPTEFRRGSLRVRVASRTRDVCRAAHQQRSLFQLHLASAASADRATYDLGAAVDGEHHIDGIPIGNYAARVSSRIGSFVWPPLEERPLDIQVVEGESLSLVVGADSLGALRLDLADANDVSYTGPAVVVVLPADEVLATSEFFNQLRELEFERAPYCIDGLEQGSYRVGFRFPKARPHPSESTVGVSIRAGATARKRYVLSGAD